MVLFFSCPFPFLSSSSPFACISLSLHNQRRRRTEILSVTRIRRKKIEKDSGVVKKLDGNDQEMQAERREIRIFWPLMRESWVKNERLIQHEYHTAWEGERPTSLYVCLSKFLSKLLLLHLKPSSCLLGSRIPFFSCSSSSSVFFIPWFPFWSLQSFHCKGIYFVQIIIIEKSVSRLLSSTLMGKMHFIQDVISNRL